MIKTKYNNCLIMMMALLLLLLLGDNNNNAGGVHGFITPSVFFSRKTPSKATIKTSFVLWDAPPSPSTTETFTDIQEALDRMEEYAPTEVLEEVVEEEDALKIRLRNELPDVGDMTKEDLILEVQKVLENIKQEILTAAQTDQLLLKKTDDSSVITPEEAAISASLYMNPLTEKIAKHVKITWEPLVADTLNRLEQVSNPGRPFMVGLVGIPGSGKSTSADVISTMLGGDDRAIVMPMDGFHVPLAELAEFPNAANAIYRRGAPDTFHAHQLEQALERIAYGNDAQVKIPGFDHAVGDPSPDQHTFQRNQHRIVICEGLYLLHDDDGWENIQQFFDWTIYIDANVDKCIDRLKERNKCIPGYTPEEIEIRCEEVDRVNAMTSKQGAMKYASQIVQSGAS